MNIFWRDFLDKFAIMANMEKWILGIILAIAGILGIVAIATKSNPPAQQAQTQNTAVTQYPTQIPNNVLQIQTTPTGNPQQAQAQQIPIPIPTSYWFTASSATIRTAKGDIVIQLYPQDAPKTVTNFSTLARLGYYNGLTFHRVEQGFVIQGGDPNGNGTGGTSIYGPTFEDELVASTSSYQAGYLEGVVAMANRGPNTNGSQFFIMLADNTTLPKNYTIFGKVTQGMDVVKQIVVGDKMLQVLVQ